MKVQVNTEFEIDDLTFRMLSLGTVGEAGLTRILVKMLTQSSDADQSALPKPDVTREVSVRVLDAFVGDQSQYVVLCRQLPGSESVTTAVFTAESLFDAKTKALDKKQKFCKKFPEFETATWSIDILSKDD